MLKLKQNKSVEGRELVNTLRGLDARGLVEKEKGPHRKGNRTMVVPHNTSRNKRTPDSTIGTPDELFCFV